MKFTTSGHYLIPLSKIYEALNVLNENSTNSILLTIRNCNSRTTKEKRNVAENLHK